ncbi:MAG: sugar kinase [Acidobacteriota bacterium]
MSSKTVVTFGEIMMRLAPPDHERLLQTPQFVATFGGGEANVAVALATLGQPASFVTALPDNPLADACVAELRRAGVDTSHIVRRAGRMGIYFVEHGANQRPSKVVYDRAASSIALAKSGDIDFAAAFADAAWLHITGITPAISATAADLALEAVQYAKKAGLFVSCDLNYRKNLWKWGRPASEVMPDIVRCCDFVIANEEDIQTTLGIQAKVDVNAGSLDHSAYQQLTQQVLDAYPNLKAVLVTLRESRSASHNVWSACVNNRDEFLTSRRYDITHIVDRVGSGDSFAAGWIYAWLNMSRYDDGLEFAVALSCLKHSVPGDFCRVSLAEVNALLKDGGSGRVQR